MKDIALAKGLQVAINTYIKEYGKILRLDLNSQDKSIETEMMLDGEKEPLTVIVSRYEIVQKEDRHLLIVHGVEASRSWINSVASSHLEGKSFLIPSKYVTMLKAVV